MDKGILLSLIDNPEARDKSPALQDGTLYGAGLVSKIGFTGCADSSDNTVHSTSDVVAPSVVI
jgi:hypothetical protein